MKDDRRRPMFVAWFELWCLNPSAAVGPSSSAVAQILLERGLHRGEGRIQAGAEGAHDDNDGHRNPGGDEAIFDGGGARVVTDETRDFGHSVLLTSLGNMPSRPGSSHEVLP